MCGGGQWRAIVGMSVRWCEYAVVWLCGCMVVSLLWGWLLRVCDRRSAEAHLVAVSLSVTDVNANGGPLVCTCQSWLDDVQSTANVQAPAFVAIAIGQ